MAARRRLAELSIQRTAHLHAAGMSKRDIRDALRSGHLTRVRQGVYAVAGAPDDRTHAAAHGGTVSCLAAARAWGLWVTDLPDDGCFHVWLGHAGEPHDCSLPHCVVRAHWDDGEAVLGSLPPVRNVLLQLAACAGEEQFFTALESALRRGLLAAYELGWLSTRLPPSMVWMLAFARSDADSGLESLIRLRLHRVGITNVRTQVRIRGVGEVDAVIGDRLILEADGKRNHEDASKRHKDLMRDARAAALGYETLRFSYAMIVHDWPVVERAILTKVASGAHLR